MLVLQAEPQRRVRLDVDFADGLYLTAVNDGDAATVDTNNGPDVAERMDAVMAAIPDGATSERSLSWCSSFADVSGRRPNFAGTRGPMAMRA